MTEEGRGRFTSKRKGADPLLDEGRRANSLFSEGRRAISLISEGGKMIQESTIRERKEKKLTNDLLNINMSLQKKLKLLMFSVLIVS